MHTDFFDYYTHNWTGIVNYSYYRGFYVKSSKYYLLAIVGQ